MSLGPLFVCLINIHEALIYTHDMLHIILYII